MADKSSAAEGSSIFESLFGGFSSGLSIFTNNPFRRKTETGLCPEDYPSEENDGEFNGSKMVVSDNVVSGQEQVDGAGQKKKMKVGVVKTTASHAGDTLEQEGKGDDEQTTAVSEEKNPESNLKKINKRADEEGVASEKKRRKTESVIDIPDDQNLKSGSSDSRKRIAEEAGGLDEGKKKMKKKITESEQQVLRQSTRNTKKRLNEDLLFSQGMGHKERKLEKTCAGIQLEVDLGELGLRPPTKRGPEDDGEDEHKKKTKRLEEIGSDQSPAPNKGAEEQVNAAPPPPFAVETRLGAKRKKDSNVEELYEKKRRETVGEKENTKAQQGDAEQDSVAPSDIADRLRGKRKLVSEEEGDAELGYKKRKTKEEEREENEERLKRTIFVGNLPMNVKAKHLLREFARFGPVESARLRSVPLVDTKLPRKAAVITGQVNDSRTSVNGYVVFHKEESAKAALAHNMTEYKGKHIRVDMAGPRTGEKTGESGIEYDGSRSIFVGNLPFDVEDEEVYTLFQGNTPDLDVEAVRIVRDAQTSIGKGFGFVCFKNKIGATTALDNAEFTRLRNRQLRILRFGFQRKPNGGNQPARASSGNYRSKPTAAPEGRFTKTNVLSYEGTRASKAYGRPGKATAQAARTAPRKGKPMEKGGSSKSGKTVKTAKRPSVAARKLASQSNSGAMAQAGGKRKREEKGVLCLPPPQPLSTSAQITGKLWSVVRSVGSYASSSFKDLLQESSDSSTMGGSMRKLLFNIEKRPEKKPLAILPSTRKTRRQ